MALGTPFYALEGSVFPYETCSRVDRHFSASPQQQMPEDRMRNNLATQVSRKQPSRKALNWKPQVSRQKQQTKGTTWRRSALQELFYGRRQ